MQYLISVHERDLVYHFNHSILPEIQYVNWCFTTGFFGYRSELYILKRDTLLSILVYL